MSDETPARYLGMTLRVYRLNAATGERTYLAVSKPNKANTDWGPTCSCPRCNPPETEQEAAS